MSAIDCPPSPSAIARRDLIVVIVGLLAVLAWDACGLDLAASRLYGTSAGFALRDHWLTRGVAHDGGRWLAAFGLVALVVNIFRPLWPGPTRRERVWWFAVTVAGMCLIPLLKHFSRTSCPWALAEFGGVAHYVSHWHWGVSDGGGGGCFPAGHPTSAAAFLSGWFVLRRHRPRAAAWWLAGTLLLTLFYGWAQWARGAHYPSHTLWTAWICWTLAWATQGLALPRGRSDQDLTRT